jgi:hypothetical protein
MTVFIAMDKSYLRVLILEIRHQTTRQRSLKTSIQGCPNNAYIVLNRDAYVKSNTSLAQKLQDREAPDAYGVLRIQQERECNSMSIR